MYLLFISAVGAGHFPSLPVRAMQASGWKSRKRQLGESGAEAESPPQKCGGKGKGKSKGRRDCDFDKASYRR